MKTWIVIGFLSLMSIAEVRASDCTDKLMVSAPEGSTVITLGPVAAKKIFAAANAAEMDGTMDLATSTWINTIQSEKIICCKLSNPRALIVDSERCQIVVDANGSLSNIDAAVLK